ncbi:MAG: hypothetical protein H0W76_20260 [Pyrinomonadaceae bacterium]|nr:hypothetical protein [Pyrinomonadaceae bacterium]
MSVAGSAGILPANEPQASHHCAPTLFAHFALMAGILPALPASAVAEPQDSAVTPFYGRSVQGLVS